MPLFSLTCLVHFRSGTFCSFFVGLGAEINVASTTVPLLSLILLACNTRPTSANSFSPSLFCSIRRRNLRRLSCRARLLIPDQCLQSDAGSYCHTTHHRRQSPQVEPVLGEVNPQHALQANRRTPIAAFWITRLDHRAHTTCRETLAPRTFASRLKSRTLICCHRECLLLRRFLSFPLHVRFNA